VSFYIRGQLVNIFDGSFEEPSVSIKMLFMPLNITFGTSIKFGQCMKAYDADVILSVFYKDIVCIPP